MLPIRHLVYGEALSLEVEGKHKEMTELLEVKEVQMFIDVGEAVNGFVGHAELSTLKLLLWNIFVFFGLECTGRQSTPRNAKGAPKCGAPIGMNV